MNRYEILQSLDRYQEIATRCYFAGQQYDVDFVFDTLLDTDKISEAVGMAVMRLATEIDPPRGAVVEQEIDGGGKVDPKFTNCGVEGSEARRSRAPIGGKQSPNLPTIVIAVLATNIDVENGSDITAQAEISSEVFDGWPDVMLDENGGWHGRGGFQDYISMVTSVGPARLIQCLQNKPPRFENVPSRFLVQSMIMRCETTAESRSAALMIFGLGNFVGWGQFDLTQKLDVEGAGYLALQFEAFRALSKIVGK